MQVRHERKDCSWRCIRSFAVDAPTEAWIDPRQRQLIGEGPSMSYATRNVFQAWLQHGRVLALALTAVVVAVCSGDGDGSVGVGTGQDPDPVAPDFPIAYTKGPLNDEDEDLQVNTDLRVILRFAVGTDLFVRDRASPTAPEDRKSVV